MIFYIILFASAYIALSAVTVYGFIDGWYRLILVALVFINVFFIGVAIYFAYCAFLSLFVNLNKPIEKQNRYYYHILVQTAFLAIKIFRVKIHISGKENIPKNGKFLFVCNHIHWLDPAVPLLVFRKFHLAFISKKETHSYPVAGLFCMRPPVFQLTEKTTAWPLKPSTRPQNSLKTESAPLEFTPKAG